MKKGVLLTTILFGISLLNVNAESYYVNNNGVEMNETQYNKMLKFYSDKYVEQVMTQSQFDTIKDADIVSTNNLYEKIISSNGEVINSEIISEEEYNNANVFLTNNNENNRESYETTYKKLSVSLTHISGSLYNLLADLNWKKVPNTRSYDVFAFMTSHFNYAGTAGTQVYYTSSGASQINYNTSSPGYNGLSNGAGFSMNLVDGSNITDYEMILASNLTVNSSSYSQGHVWVSYQHAQSDLSRANSMSYTLSLSGLGNVVYYSNTSIRAIYDGMSGITINQDIN